MSAGEEWANLASRSRAHTATQQGSYREQKWVRRQKKVFKNWVNLRIAGRNVQPVKDLFVDLQDGWVMYHLCEALGGTSLRGLGKMSKGKMRLHHVANMNIVRGARGRRSARARARARALARFRPAAPSSLAAGEQER